MLDAQTFKTVIENAPLVSIDLCFIFEGQILLGKHGFHNSALDAISLIFSKCQQIMALKKSGPSVFDYSRVTSIKIY